MAKQPATDDDESARAASRAARKERRRGRTREEILAAARKILIESGLSTMTLDAVAAEAGMSKTGLYYYFPSKDALVFELIYGTFERHAHTVHDAVAKTADGEEALAAVIRETMAYFAPRLDDFRLAFMFGQVASAGALVWDDEQFARIRPLNDLVFAEAAARLREGRKKRAGRAKVEPRLAVFLAHAAAVGLLTMKGMVEKIDDPLLYSDEELTEALARIFVSAMEP